MKHDMTWIRIYLDVFPTYSRSSEGNDTPARIYRGIPYPEQPKVLSNVEMSEPRRLVYRGTSYTRRTARNIQPESSKPQMRVFRGITYWQ